jgi:hypothetical protein
VIFWNASVLIESTAPFAVPILANDQHVAAKQIIQFGNYHISFFVNSSFNIPDDVMISKKSLFSERQMLYL